jgi:hypothetical protein
VVIARRAGTRWHLAGLNADEAPATLSLDLGFLGPAGQLGRITTDGDGPRDLVCRPLRSGRQVTLTLAPRGGFIAEFDRHGVSVMPVCMRHTARSRR